MGRSAFELKVRKLVGWLNENRKDLAPYRYEEKKWFFKVSGRNGICLFIAKTDFKSKNLRKIYEGGFYKPVLPHRPARESRGHIDRPDDWPVVFDQWGMTGLKKGELEREFQAQKEKSVGDDLARYIEIS